MTQPLARMGATIDDLYKVEGKAEIVGGEIVLMSPAGFLHGRVAFFVGESSGPKFVVGAPVFAVEVLFKGSRRC